MADSEGRHRGVRSYVRRLGRMTGGQRRALETLWDRFGISGVPSVPETVFGRSAPCVLEIGFGNGEALLARAVTDPDRDYIGLEVHRPGIGHLLLGLAVVGVTNVRVIEADAATSLDAVAPGVFSEVCVWFPDPWPKKRHHKRRLVQPAFLSTLARVLRPRGVLHLATDDASYAEAMRALLDMDGRFGRIESDGRKGRPVTRFERRALQAGRPVWDLRYSRLQDPEKVEPDPADRVI